MTNPNSHKHKTFKVLVLYSYSIKGHSKYCIQNTQRSDWTVLALKYKNRFMTVKMSALEALPSLHDS